MRKMVTVLMTLCFIFLSFTSVAAESNEKKTPGTYFVEIEAENDEGVVLTKIMKVTVIGDHTVISHENGEAIDANDFRTHPNEVLSLSQEELIELANAYAWSLDTGLEIPVYSSSVNAVSKKMYHVKFSTKLGTSTTVNAIELDSDFFNWDRQLINPGGFYFLNLFIPPIWLLIIMFIPLLVISLTYFLTKKRIKKANRILYEKQNHQKEIQMNA